MTLRLPAAIAATLLAQTAIANLTRAPIDAAPAAAPDALTPPASRPEAPHEWDWSLRSDRRASDPLVELLMQPTEPGASVAELPAPQGWDLVVDRRSAARAWEGPPQEARGAVIPTPSVAIVAATGVAALGLRRRRR